MSKENELAKRVEQLSEINLLLQKKNQKLTHLLIKQNTINRQQREINECIEELINEE